MAVTKLGDIINPQVMGDMIDAKIEAQLKLTPYAKVDTTLQGVPGNTITVPAWNYIGDAEDFDPENANGDEIGVTNLTAGSTDFTVKSIGKSVGILQTAINSGLGNPVGQAETQLAKSIASKVDRDVLDIAYTASMVYEPSTLAPISYAGVVGANTKFEDEEDGVEKVMFIHPNQEETILLDPMFTSADKYQAGTVVNGAIGKVAGANVKKSRRVKFITFEKATSGSITIVADSESETSTAKHLATVQPNCAAVLAVGDKVNSLTAANQYYLNPIIKMEADSDETEYTEDELPAITIYLKKETQVDHEWFPKKQRHDITASKYYGVAKTNDAKIVLAKFKK